MKNKVSYKEGGSDYSKIMQQIVTQYNTLVDQAILWNIKVRTTRVQEKSLQCL